MKLVLSLLLFWYQVHHSVWGQLSGSGDTDLLCNTDQFECVSRRVCIDKRLLCDGNEDCPLGEDEAVCPSNCHLDQFRCVSNDACVSLRQVCDGVMDCDDHSDEASCGLSGSVCERNEFACSLMGPCIPLAFLCNGVGNCPNGDDESLCEKSEVDVQVPREVLIIAGDSVTLSCDAIGYSPPFVTWRRNLMPLPKNARYNFTSQNGFGVLHIRDASLEDAGEYHCEVISGLHGSQLILPSTLVEVMDDFPMMCINHVNQEFPGGSYYYDVRPVGVGPASQAAADIIFIVDESGSMAMEHQWLREEARILDRRLKNQGVGAGSRNNLFALVGFGRNDPNAILGTTITELTSAGDFVSASEDLVLSGAFEDGYAAISYALENIMSRPNTAKQLILITDEDRGVIRFDLTRDLIENRLREAGYILNVVVNQGFQTTSSDNSSFALGVNAEVAFIFDPFSSNLFSALTMNNVIPSEDFRFGNTFEDYVELALAVGGAAWDLNQLREQGLLARAFTNAFLEAKVEEVMTIFSFCFECLCKSFREVCSLASDVSIENCMGAFPVLQSAVTPESTYVKSGSDVTFECLSYTNFDNLSVTYEWIYPPNLGSTVRVEDQVLTVENVDFSTGVNLTCMVTLVGTGLVSSADARIIIDTRCQLPDWSYLVLGDMRRILSPRTSNLTQAADIILLVDESGSMAEEHAWISSMIPLLDRALKDVDVGVDVGNRFGVVGFGDDCNEGNVFGRVLLSSGQEQFAPADNITDFTRRLSIGGRMEDGYSAITIALDAYSFRDVAKQFILITDEDRDVVEQNLTRDGVRALLEDAGVMLNAAINEEFQGDNLKALGIDGNGNAYVYDPSIRTSFRVLESSGTSVQDSAFGSTNTDYTQLALELSGAAWDLTQLRQGGGVAEAFTSAFIEVKVLEIQRQLSSCMNCTCSEDGPVCNLLPNANFSFCMRIPDPPRPGEMPLSVMIEGSSEITILPSETRSFTCRANSSAVIRWSFNGGNLPANVEVNGTGGYKSVLTISTAMSNNAGVYTCLVHSQSGAFRDSASLQAIFYDPEQDLMLVLSPLQPMVTRGDNITLSCSVQSPSALSWLFNDGPLPVNSLVDAVSASISLLTLVSVEDVNAGAYTCTASSLNTSVINDDTAYVEVIDLQLKLLVSPADIISVEEGMPAELVCQLDCFCPGVRPVWSRPDNTPLPQLVEITSSDNDVIAIGAGIESVLLISSVSIENGGLYLCSAEFDGTTVTAEAYINVTSEERFEVMILSDSQVEIVEGASQFLVCETNQNASSIMWTFNEIPIQVQGAESGDSSEVPPNVVAIEVSQIRTVLSILQANPLNSGPYQCTAIAALGSEEAVASVNISVQ